MQNKNGAFLFELVLHHISATQMWLLGCLLPLMVGQCVPELSVVKAWVG